MINTKYLVLPVVSSLLVSGCGLTKKNTAPPLTAANSIHASLPAPRPVRPLATRPVPVTMARASGVRAGSDLISAQDLLSVTVFKVPDLTREIRVDDRGNITFPLIGSVRAKGMKPAQLERVIAQKLEKTYMNNPQVTVVVTESVRNRVTVEGAVKQAGVFPVSGNMTVLQAIALAGGLDTKADVHHAILLRRNARGQVSQQAIDLAAIREGRMQDLALLQDDRIVVQEATYNRFTVDGSVASPGVFELKPGMTFMQAVAVAGGITELANKEQANLFRRDRNGNFRRYLVNLQAIREGRAADPLLERDDRIVMVESGTRTFLRDASRFVNPIRLF